MESVCDMSLPIEAARQGDPAAWETLFKRFQLPLFTYLMELVHQEETCFDLVQETFLTATKYLQTLKHDEYFATWLFKIAHQKAVQRWRYQKRRIEEVNLESHAAENWSEEDLTPLDFAIRQEEVEIFWKGMDRLPQSQKQVLLLHWLEEFTLEQIAEITGAPVGTVKSRLYLARNQLRRRLKPGL